jgi:signal transduction histidine kinase
LAPQSLLFTINDLLVSSCLQVTAGDLMLSKDLTRLESGKQISLNEAFDLQAAIEEATRVYRNEAARRNLKFKLDVSQSPKMVVGDPKKIMTVVANLTANARKPT